MPVGPKEKDEALMSRAPELLIPFRRILVPVDFSDSSKEALRCAVPLARHFHGYTGIKHVVFGSTAENVVRHSPCPVLTMRACATK